MIKSTIEEVSGSSWHVPKNRLQVPLSFCLSTILLLGTASGVSAGMPKGDKAAKTNKNVNFDRTIKGKVIDDKGETLPGVSIMLKGSSKGAITNENGEYQLSVPNDKSILVFSYVGFITQEAVVGTRTAVNITLESDTKALDELVVIGYGTTKKSDLTGSVGTVAVSDMVKAPVASFAEAMAGRVAGVQVSTNDGQPGGDVNIMIRGAGSLTQNTSPLYVVDGFPIENLDPRSINPEDIKNISILKDASATAIYGSRAANGVVLIETKRGMVGKPVITLSTSQGFQLNPKQMELMSPYEFLKYQLELHPTRATTLAYFTNDRTLEDYRDVKGINFQDLVIRTGEIKQYNVSIRGGTQQTKYSISGSIFDQKGVVINTGLNRYSGRIAIDQTISPKLKAGVVANYAGSNQYGQVINSATAATGGSPSSYVLMRTWSYRPVAPSEDIDLELEPADEGAINPSDFRINPFIDLQNQHQMNYINTLDANAYITYDIARGLQFKTTAGLRHINGLAERFYNSKTSQGSPSNPNNLNGINGSIANNLSKSFSSETSLNYQTKFGNHGLNAFALFSINGLNTQNNGYGGRMLPNENLGIDGLDQGVSYSPGSSRSSNRMASFAGRLEYNYMSKYMATFTYRADGSSKFVQPWGYFPSAALAWNMDKETFFRAALPFISTSKLRASYGTTGNNRVSDFAPLPSLSQSLSGYSFNNSTPIGMTNVNAVGNSALRWEKVKTLDIGYEVGAFQNRITLEVDLYRRTTTDLLLAAALPPTTGFGSSTKNIGELRNDGLEITLNTVNIEHKDYGWSSSFNIAFNRNKIMALTRGQQSITANGQYEGQFNKPLYVSEVGKPAGMMIGYIWEGNYQYADFDNPSPGVYVLKSNITGNGAVRNTIQPGDIKYRDMDGDLQMTDNDLTTIGRGQPLHIGGFNNNFHYKGLSLNVFFQWAYGNNIYNANRLALEANSNGRVLVNQFASFINRWSPENQTNENHRAAGPGPVGLYSSKQVEDGSFLRLKTVALEYSLPISWINRFYLTNVTLSASAQNLLTWQNYSGLDPEVSIISNKVLAPGFDFSGYPQVRTLTFGIKASF